MAIDSATKQELMRRHINQVVEQKKKELEKLYETRKKEGTIERFARRGNEIRNALDGILERARKLSDEFEESKKRVGYEEREYEEIEIEVPTLSDKKIKEAVEREVEADLKARRAEFEAKLEQARLEAIEKVLFADEKQLLATVSRIKEMKVEL